MFLHFHRFVPATCVLHCRAVMNSGLLTALEQSLSCQYLTGEDFVANCCLFFSKFVRHVLLPLFKTSEVKLDFMSSLRPERPER